jgi:Transposase DDE domain
MAGTRKGTYKITNWSKYNESLVQRGSITFWFCEETIEKWRHDNANPGVGHPFVYSDTAVECLLVLRELFQLPYRQTEGLGKSLVELMQIELDIPDYTSLAKRAAKMGVSLDIAKHSGKIDVVVDSTGLKVFGEGEWKMRKHGKSKRRTWRKLHLAVNPQTHEIEAETLTDNSCDDASQVDGLLDQATGKIGRFYGDGAYDKWKVYETLGSRKIRAIIPPQRNARIKRHGNSRGRPLSRDVAIRAIRHRGRRRWKKDVGYHRRSLSETAMYRMKCCFGDHLKNREIQNQRTETRLRSKILNKFTHLGLPQFEWN